MTGKRREPILRVVPRPGDINANGHIFGGWVLSQMDIAAGIVAVARGGRAGRDGGDRRDGVHRPDPACTTSSRSTPRSSGSAAPRSRSASRSIASRDRGRDEVKVTEGLFTFVALDENHRPRPVKTRLAAQSARARGPVAQARAAVGGHGRRPERHAVAADKSALGTELGAGALEFGLEPDRRGRSLVTISAIVSASGRVARAGLDAGAHARRRRRARSRHPRRRRGRRDRPSPSRIGRSGAVGEERPAAGRQRQAEPLLGAVAGDENSGAGAGLAHGARVRAAGGRPGPTLHVRPLRAGRPASGELAATVTGSGMR